jgi:hypothetical protein
VPTRALWQRCRAKASFQPVKFCTGQSKGSGRFLKKAAQKFFSLWALGAETARAQSNKVFLLLFVHKKQRFLP